MPTRFEHRAGFSVPAATVYATLVDRTFLDERLRAIGGKGATVVEHTAAGDGVTFRLRQGMDAQKLPGAVRAIVNGDLIVDREERWQADGTGTAKVTIAGVPGEIRSQTRLADRAGGSEQVVTAEVKVSIPLVGGKIEGMIAQQVGKLLAAEAEFAGKWLAGHGS